MPFKELKQELKHKLKKKFGGKSDERADGARKVLVDGKLQPIKHLANEPDEQIAATSIISPSLISSPVPAANPSASTHTAGPASPRKGKGRAPPIEKSAISKAMAPAETVYYYDDSGIETAAPAVNPHLGLGHVYESSMSPNLFYEAARAAPPPPPSPSRPKGLNITLPPPPPPPPPSAAAAAAAAAAITATGEEVPNDFAGLGISIPRTPTGIPRPATSLAPNELGPGGPDLWDLPAPRKPLHPRPSYFALAGTSKRRGDAGVGPSGGSESGGRVVDGLEGAILARREYRVMLDELHRRAKERRAERWKDMDALAERIERGEETAGRIEEDLIDLGRFRR